MHLTVRFVVCVPNESELLIQKLFLCVAFVVFAASLELRTVPPENELTCYDECAKKMTMKDEEWFKLPMETMCETSSALLMC